MKIIFSSISRLIFAYSKFFAGLVLLGSIGTFAHSSEGQTYLKCNDSYQVLIVTYLDSNFNVRTKKFKNYFND
tara:strand:+ start:151 stop:369 length:219 start_codon:yes stop_codon:yes gene_type:complete